MIQEEPVFQFESKGRRRLMSQPSSLAGVLSACLPFCSILEFSLSVNEPHPHQGGQSFDCVYRFRD